MRGRLFFVFGWFLAAALLLAPSWVWAQGGGAGELTGIVTDATGAVVPKADVNLTRKATGVVRTTQTTAAGVYRFVGLPVGTYDMRVTAPGFRTAEFPGIVISVGLTYTQDVRLEVGAIGEVVTVEARGQELVQSTESQVSSLIDSQYWKYQPLEERNQNIFINLVPGSVPDAFAGSTRGAAVSGARGGTGNFLVEGYDNNDQGQGGRGAIVSGAITAISPEAIEEYRIIQHNYAAEYGKGGGFVTDTVLRSGTNYIHGSAFWYNRNQKLTANDFFSNREGVQDSRIRNQFGGSLGGPIIPDKTFIHGTIEIHRFREDTPRTAVATTQAFLDFVNSGAFAAFHESDPAGVCGGACPGAFAQSSSLGPIFSALIASQNFPVATSNFSNVGAGLYSFGVNYPVPVYGDVTQINESVFNENRFSLKLDHKASEKSSFSGTFLFEDSDTSDSIDGADTTIGGPLVSVGRSILAGVTYTRTFSPTVINTARVSWLRHTRDFPTVPGAEGIPSIVTAFDPLTVGLGQISALPQFFTDNQFQYQDHVAWVRGKHSFKAGAEYRRTRNGSAFEAIKNGLFTPYGIEDLVTDGIFSDEADLAFFGGPAYGSWFYAFAAADPTTGGLAPEFYRGYRANEFAAYIQDDIRVTSRLTINAGLRWEYFGVPHNFRAGIDSNYYFGSGLTPTPNPSGSANVFYPFNSPLHARVVNGNFFLRDSEIWNKDTNNFAPRLGFAWDVKGDRKVVIRGGGGVFYDRIWNNLFENIRFNLPFYCFCLFGTFINGNPAGALATPGIYAVPFTDAQRVTLFGFTGVSGSARHMDQNLLSAYWQQYFLGVQYQFAPDFVFETNYVSTLGRKLHGVADINTFNGRVRGGGSARPATQVTSDNYRTNAFRSNYHGLQVQVRKRMSHGLQFNANYTWGHAIDQISDAFNSRTGLRPRDNFNHDLDRANADFDIRHRFVTSFFYQLPLWKENRIAGGWSISGSFTAQTGRPVPLFHSGSAGDANADGYRTDGLLFTGSGDVNDLVSGSSPADGYFDTSPFSTMSRTSCIDGQIATTTRWWCNGILGRNVLIGPGFADVTFGVAKAFRVTETATVSFQANFFNLFNRANFNAQSSMGNLNSSAFGRSLDTFAPRITQLAIRFDW